MDFNGNYPLSNPPSPEAIIQEYSDDFYHICWKPSKAGIVLTAPGLVKKDELIKEYPHVVEAWKARQRLEKEEANQIEGKFLAFGSRFFDRDSDKRYTESPQRGVACDQSLRPGMHRHWGELRKCEAHPPGRPSVHTCKGCRVGHYTQESRTFDRQLVMARGARVLVCENCAETLNMGAKLDCICDSRWTCFRCRKGELKKLAKAREEHTEGHCGKCSEAGDLVQHVDFCLHCRGWRVYVASSEDLWDKDGDE